jgi:hypothetical protein
MMKEEFTVEERVSNSHKSKEKAAEEKKVNKVISGTAKVKKKSGTRKLADIFVSEDVSNVKTYIFSDVIVPAAKKLVSDIVKDGIEMLLYGGTSQRRTYSDGFRAGFVDYNKLSGRRDDRRPSYDNRTKIAQSYDNIVLEHKGDAEVVLTTMDDIIDSYGEVSVAALFDLVGLPHKYTDNNYGWTSLGNARVTRVRDGYLLDLPRAVPLKD